MGALQFFQQHWPSLLAGFPGALALYREWARRKAAVQVHRSDLVKIAQEAAAAVIGELRHEADRLRKRVDELEAEITDMRRSHMEMIQAKDAKITLLEGEKHQLEARIAGLERLLERNNIPVPQPRAAFFELAASGELRPGVAS